MLAYSEKRDCRPQFPLSEKQELDKKVCSHFTLSEVRLKVKGLTGEEEAEEVALPSWRELGKERQAHHVPVGKQSRRRN